MEMNFGETLFNPDGSSENSVFVSFFFSTFNKIMQFSVTLSFHYNLVLVITRSCFTSEILNSNFLFSDDFSPFLFIFLYSCKTYTSNSLSFSSQSIPPILLFHQALIFAQINILSQILLAVSWKCLYYLSVLLLSFCQTHIAKPQILDEHDYLHAQDPQLMCKVIIVINQIFITMNLVQKLSFQNF